MAATASQNLIFHMLGNKAKLDLNRNMPSRLPTTVVPPAANKGFWAGKLNGDGVAFNEMGGGGGAYVNGLHS